MYAVQHNTPTSNAVADLFIFRGCSKAMAMYPIIKMVIMVKIIISLSIDH
jgi:hypothetical protein